MKRIIAGIVLLLIMFSLCSCLLMLGSLIDDSEYESFETSEIIDRNHDTTAEAKITVPVTTDKSSTDSSKPDDDSIRPSVKEAIDNYESFVDTYCEFMSSYSSFDISQLARYTELLSQMTEMEASFKALENDLTTAELEYYSEVSLRCAQKLLKATTSIFG